MFETLLIKPLYNGFVALIGVVPGGDAGVAIVILTVLLRILFFPIFSKGIRTQVIMRRIAPELEAVKERYKKDPAERAKKTMEIMRRSGARPFSSFFAALIQVPVFIALYIVFLREGFPDIAEHLLYPFTPAPETVNTVFLGVLQLTLAGNITLAAFVALAQHVQGRLTFARSKSTKEPEGLSPERRDMLRIQESVQRTMFVYFLPLMMGGITYTFPSAAGLYLITGSIFSIGQELFIRRSLEKNDARSASVNEPAPPIPR